MKRKARNLYPMMHNPDILADNLQFCSCYMCGNPRKWWKEQSFKEKKFKAIPIDIE